MDTDDPLLVGEMAHVIGKRGPRSKKGGGADTYDNLILLCPTHHTMVDKAWRKYPIATLHEWKAKHEARVRQALAARRFESKAELCGEIERLLIENQATWKTYGPESDEAERNPLSNAVGLWILRKLSEVIPNNRRIINMVKENKQFFTGSEYATCCTFIEHAEGFEQSAYERNEGVPRFPTAFEEVMRHARELQ